ncbi:hypothetical protein ACFXKX_02515 [Streptomyces scopuliridis]|uniref:hypothetical protein n=1 Tax=Streptomyces scopuliridis TaxID=452529 RepID=UPI0036A28F92
MTMSTDKATDTDTRRPPPTETERLLYEATARDDVETQLRVPAGAELYIGAPRAEVDADAGMARRRAYRDEAGRSRKPSSSGGIRSGCWRSTPVPQRSFCCSPCPSTARCGCATTRRTTARPTAG